MYTSSRIWPYLSRLSLGKLCQGLACCRVRVRPGSWRSWLSWRLHPWKLTNVPFKRDNFARKYIFQPFMFREHVSFPGAYKESIRVMAPQDGAIKLNPPKNGLNQIGNLVMISWYKLHSYLFSTNLKSKLPTLVPQWQSITTWGW